MESNDGLQVRKSPGWLSWLKSRFDGVALFLKSIITHNDEQKEAIEGDTSTPVIENAQGCLPEKCRRPLTYGIGICSNIGTRSRNEDFAGYLWQGESLTFSVSDGIGGAADGDIMSRVGCGGALLAFKRGGSALDAFHEGAHAAYQTSMWLGDEDSGATLVCGSISNGVLSVTWAGDSIVLAMRGGSISCIADPDRARPGSNALGSAIGYSDSGDLSPRTSTWDLAPGDVLIACTDGVWEAFAIQGEQALSDLLSRHVNAPLLAQEVCEEAVRINIESKGSSDNSTCIVVVVA